MPWVRLSSLWGAIGVALATIGGCSATEGDDPVPPPDYASCTNTDVGGAAEPVSWLTGCGDFSCAADEEARTTLSRLASVLQDQGAGDAYRFLRARSVAAGVEVTLLVVLDWFQAVNTLVVPALDDDALTAWTKSSLCLSLPAVAPYGKFVASLEACNATIQHDICTNAFRPPNGCTPVGGGGGMAKPGEGECNFVTYGSARATSGSILECENNQEICP